MYPRYLCADGIPGIGHMLLCKDLAEPEEIMAELKYYLTKCPNCGEPNSSKTLRYSTGDPVMTTVDGKMLCDIEQHNILLAPPQLPLYIKRCNKCGFVSFFDADIIAKNGKL